MNFAPRELCEELVKLGCEPESIEVGCGLPLCAAKDFI